MRLLTDTNNLLRLSDLDDPMYSVVAGALSRLYMRGDVLVMVPQVIYEFWAVVTRPESSNGLGWTPEQARLEVDRLRSVFDVLPELPETFSHWLELVTIHKASGKPSHDVRLVAAMQANGLETLLTLNGGDFKRYGIKVLHPSEI